MMFSHVGLFGIISNFFLMLAQFCLTTESHESSHMSFAIQTFVR